MPENPGAEQPIPLRLERAVVDRLGLLDLAEGPAQHLLGAGDRDADLIERLGRDLRVEEIHDLLIHTLLLNSAAPRGRASVGRR
jgi:hypothetical protein